MNYLAHLFLSEDTPEARIGNLMGDFIKSESLEPYPIPFRHGVALHRKIDIYTDAHPLFQSSCQWISADRRRFAGVLNDIFYDHFLAVHWSQYSSIPLRQFVETIYTTLVAYKPILPETLQQIIPDMVKEDWLTAYGELSGVGKALERVSRRIRWENTIASAVDELENNYSQLEADFIGFFPDLNAYTQSQIQKGIV